MEAKDPFASISELCHVSSSQEDRLRHCRFAHEPQENDNEDEEEEEEGSEDSREIPAGIIMVSPPDSSAADDFNEGHTPHDTDIFQTPPEGSFLATADEHRDNRTDFVEEEISGGCTEEERTVDLGADTDLRFSEVELTQRLDCENEVIDCESDTIRVLKREMAIKECLRNSELEKQKTSDKGLGSESPIQCLGESRKQSKSNRASPYNCDSKSLQNNKNTETFGESITKRKLHSRTKVMELEASDGVSGFSEGLENNIRDCEGYNGDREKNRNLCRKSIEDLGPSADSSLEMVRTKRMRTLPVSVCGQTQNSQKELDSGKNRREITLLDMLKMLAEKRGYDRSLENKSILDVAKSRGMTFPC